MNEEKINHFKKIISNNKSDFYKEELLKENFTQEEYKILISCILEVLYYKEDELSYLLKESW